MKTNLLTSRLNNRPGTQASSPAFKEVRSPGRTIICPGAQPNSPASPERRGGGTGAGWYTRLQAALNNKTAIRFAKYLIPITILLLFLLLLALVASCKSPATLTNDTQHHTRDSNYHATVHRIETHDTIIFGAPYIQSMVRPGDRTSLKAGGDACVPGQRPSKSPLKGDLDPPCPSLKGMELFSPFKGEPEGVLVRISDRKITIRDTVFIARTDTLLRTQTITQKERYIPPFYRFCTISFVSFVSFVTLHLVFICFSATSKSAPRHNLTTGSHFQWCAALSRSIYERAAHSSTMPVASLPDKSG